MVLPLSRLDGTPMSLALAERVRRVARLALPAAVGVMTELTCRELFASEGWGFGASAFAFGTTFIVSLRAFDRPGVERSMGGGAVNALLIGLVVVVLGIERMRADYLLAVSVLLTILFALGAFVGVVVGYSFRPFAAPLASNPDDALRLPFLLALWFSSAALLVDWVGPGGLVAALFALMGALMMGVASARFFSAHAWLLSLASARDLGSDGTLEPSEATMDESASLAPPEKRFETNELDADEFDSEPLDVVTSFDANHAERILGMLPERARFRQMALVALVLALQLAAYAIGLLLLSAH